MIVGLTGGIGSGKSVVAKLFEMLGCVVFNSDQAAKEIYFDKDVREKVIALLGPESYLSPTQINKNYISAQIFNDAALLNALNHILHPAVGERFKITVTNNPGKIIVKETALLFEAKLTAQVDKIVLVTAGEDLRITRAMARDGLTREAVIKKMNAQLPQEEKIKQADFVIDNNEAEFITPQVLNIINQLIHA